MAASGPMAEFARMPPQKKAMVFVAIGMLLGLVYWKFAYKELDDQLEQAQAQHNNKVQKAKTLGDDVPKFAELRARMTKLHELIEKNQTALPSEIELAAFYETLQRKLNESGAEIRKWSNGTPEPIESFVRVPIEVEMTGTFLQIKRFFASLVQHDVRAAPGAEGAGPAEPERIVSIENLALTNPTLVNREVVLNAKFTAVTYRQEDKTIAPDKPANGQPAPAGAAKPAAPRPAPPPLPGSAPPPLPSAATPAGAKVRVENALDKGDARNRAGADAADGRGGSIDGAKGSARLKGGL
jgi:type IV pilus assembly protein PilO